jgi:predicted nuclease of predicted toxin-antitoxin system
LDLPQNNATPDSEILRLVSDNDRVVITKDSDFLNSYLIKGIPRKLILVKTGNIPNRALLKLFDENITTVIKMLSRNNLVEINRTEIIEHK